MRAILVRGYGEPWRSFGPVWGVVCMSGCLVVLSEKETSCAISASVLVWNEPVLLMTMGMMTTSTFQGLC